MNENFSTKYPRTLLEANALHSMLNTLGYSVRDEIFLILNPNGVFVRLKAGGKEVDMRMGKPEYDLEKMKELWIALNQDWVKASDEEKKESFDKSMVSSNRVAVLAALVTNGFNRWVKR